MGSMDECMLHDFSADNEELHRVHDTADLALSTLQDFSYDGTWPYEVTGGARTNLKDYSFSLSAAILHSIASAASQLRLSVPVPPMMRSREEHYATIRNRLSNLDDLIRTGLGRFLNERAGLVKRSTMTPTPISYSRPFGDNDPFTLLALLGLFPLLGGVKDVPNLDGLRSDVLACALNLVKRTYESPSSAVILAMEGALDHAFPIVKVVGLDIAAKKYDPHYCSPDSATVLCYLQNKLSEHLSRYSIADSGFDPAELAFAMEGILLIDADILDGQQLQRCLAALEETQQRNPSWRPLRPFVATKTGICLLPLSVDIANSLLDSFDILAKYGRTSVVLSGHFRLFSTYTDWLLTRVVYGTDTEQRQFTGWHSEHVAEPGKIHLWETSQMLLYMLHYEALLPLIHAQRSS